MKKKEKCIMFARLLDSSYYFSVRNSRRNHWQWTSNRDDAITIYGDDPLQISGLDDIGSLAHSLELTCYVSFDFYTRRIEVNVF